MNYIKWVLLIVVGALLGWLVVEYMTVHPLQMNLFLFLSTLTAVVLVIIIARFFTSKWTVPLAIFLSLIAITSSYLISTRIFLAEGDDQELPELTRAKGDPGDGHTAIVYFTHGEPETYNPIGWINQFNEFDRQDIPFVPLIARPIFIHQLRSAYLKVGSSHHRQMHLQMLTSLEEAYRLEGDTSTKFYISFLDDDPRPDAAVIQALNEGASHIIISEVFLTISNHTAEGEELVKEINVEEYGAILTFTGPLYDSDTLRSMFVQRAADHIGDTPTDKVGVLLVGHGQPDEWDVEWPTETEQEISFRMDVLNDFELAGYPSQNLSLAWMEFKEPKPASKVEEFIANGVEKVVFFAAAISADSIHSQYDIPELVHEADTPEGFPLINLGAWNDDPLVIQAIKEKIDQAMIAQVSKNLEE
jgi:protoheme ferro-lyase